MGRGEAEPHSRLRVPLEEALHSSALMAAGVIIG